MEDKFYTINQVAELLDLHHKTIRNFIAEGRLRATKVGKQWRIAEEDLRSFTVVNTTRVAEEDLVYYTDKPVSEAPASKISVSCVVDIEDLNKDEFIRVSNTLIAIMNGRDPKRQKTTLHMKYYEEDCRMKVMLWGHTAYIEEMLSTISMLVES